MTHPHLQGWRGRALQDVRRTVAQATVDHGAGPELTDGQLELVATRLLGLLLEQPSQVGDLIRAQLLMSASQAVEPNPHTRDGRYTATEVRSWLTVCAGAYTAAHAQPEDAQPVD